MDYKKYRYDGSSKFKLSKAPTSAHIDKARKEEYVARTLKNSERIGELQDRLYAQGREGVVVVFQAMDAAGKDSAIKHVMRGINPSGVSVADFKTPTSEELAHDYLWRVWQKLPRRGTIGIFNRSHYEDVLVVDVRDIWKNYKMPERCLKTSRSKFFSSRYERIRGFEEHLYENGYRVVKFFLHVGLEAQQKRFLDRIDEPAKNWKFSEGDLEERALWDKYMKAYEATIDNTSTTHAPWYVIPADQKWYARWLISEILVDVLEDINPRYPELTAEQTARLADCKEALLATEKIEVAYLGKEEAQKVEQRARACSEKKTTESKKVGSAVPEVPAVKQPAAKQPAAKTQATKATATKTSTAKASAVKASATKPAAAKAPAAKAPAAPKQTATKQATPKK